MYIKRQCTTLKGSCVYFETRTVYIFFIIYGKKSDYKTRCSFQMNSHLK